MAAGSIVYRSFRSGDEGAVVRLLEEFSQGGYSLEQWVWSFPFEADGRAIVVGEIGGRIAAVCAGAPTRVVVDRRTCPAVEIRELAAHDPEGARGAVEYFVETVRRDTRFDLAVTALDVDHEVLAGFETAQRDRSVLLQRERSGGAGVRRYFYRAEPARDWEPRLDRLWERVKGSYPVASVRDAEGWLRRFAGHPTRRHHRFLVCRRFSSEAVAAAIFSDEDSRCRWLDLIWDHAHPGALELLSHISARLARQFDSDLEELWMGGDDKTADLLAGWKFRKQQATAFFAALAFDPQLDAADLVDRIYLTWAEVGIGDR